MTDTVVDMHIHTTRGASDSSLRPVELARAARRLGLAAVVVTEHDRLWDPLEVARFRQERSLLLINGMEVSTDLGHVVVIGLHTYLPAIRYAEELRRIVNEADGYMIAAHPFRHYFNRVEWERRGLEPRNIDPAEAARLPLLSLVDAVEVLNGGNSLQENAFALEVAQILGKPGVAGSDAHSHQGIGIYTTVFERSLDSEADLLRELRAGRFYPADGLLQGNLQPFTLETEI
jgi:predicted metal-dependent phosphoesterase TrpH